MDRLRKARWAYRFRTRLVCLTLFAASTIFSSCGKETGEQRQEIPKERADIRAEAAVTVSGNAVREKEAEPPPEEAVLSGNDAAYEKGRFDDYGEQYSLIETEKGEWEVTLYDKENKVVHKESFLKLPNVMEMTDNILQIWMGNGSPASLYVYYFDKERAVVSGVYSDLFYLRDHYTAYFKDEKTLVLTDIFEEGELYQEIKRDFSDSMMPYLAVKEITWITLHGQDVVVLEYFEGEERELITELIPVGGGEAPVFYEADEIAKTYEILADDICGSARYDFENVHPTVREHIIHTLQKHEEISQKCGRELQISVDYHLFDFNDDGLDDYLLCIDRELYDGRVEHWITIDITREERGWITKEEMGDITVRQVLWLNLPAGGQTDETAHKQITVLRDQIDGFYTIVLPGTNSILRYNGQEYVGEYQFCDQ